MSSYDDTKQGIVQITTYVITELMSGMKPREYLKKSIPLDTKRVNSHFPNVIETLENNGIIELVLFKDSDFKGYKLAYSFQNNGNNFKGDMSVKSMSQDIKTLDIDNRTENALRAAGVNTLGDLIKYNPDNHSRKIPNLGNKGVKQIEHELKKIGLFLRY